jgi:hypothetical protein
VVGDQIKALSELSDIVSRHGKTLDISSPQLGEPRAAQSRSLDMQPVASAVGAEQSWPELDTRRMTEPEPPRPPLNEPTLAPVANLGATPLRPFETTRRLTNGNGGGGRAEARPTPIARPEPLRTAVAAPPRPTVTPRPPPRLASPSAAPLTPSLAAAPPPPPPAYAAPAPPMVFSPPQPPAAFPAPPPATFGAPPPPATPAPPQDERGWVSDLLRRASRDEEVPAEHSAAAGFETEPAPMHEVNGAVNGSTPPAPASAEPLNALSMDIARAIDHDASVELWERHRRGERNLFTRRLYTLQGQQTFDEIRKKYQRDEDFRSAVDRYIQDFEKLLAEVSRNSKDRNASNAYLTSDTGKVYTMLAHASGRFD